MTHTEFVHLTKKTLDKQQAFFKHKGKLYPRHTANEQRMYHEKVKLLEESKQLEKELRKAINDFEGQQTSLGL